MVLAQAVASDQEERAYTYADLLAFPEDTQRREVIGGELIVSPSPDWWHQALLLHTRDLIVRSPASRTGNVAVAPLDVRLSPYDTAQPDILFITHERMTILAPDNRISGPPDLAVEILSPTSRRLDRVRKFALYANAGVPEYWILDSPKRAVDAFGLADGFYLPLATDDAGRPISRILPGFVVDPAEIFSVLPAGQE